jgi:hypothetical protein
VILLYLVLYVRAWRRRLPRWGTLSLMQAGAGLGLLLMALHGLTEPAPTARKAVTEFVPSPVPVVRPNVKNPFAD